eukprot:174697-Prymnesium_polylepis.1
MVYVCRNRPNYNPCDWFPEVTLCSTPRVHTPHPPRRELPRAGPRVAARLAREGCSGAAAPRGAARQREGEK